MFLVNQLLGDFIKFFPPSPRLLKTLNVTRARINVACPNAVLSCRPRLLEVRHFSWIKSVKCNNTLFEHGGCLLCNNNYLELPKTNLTNLRRYHLSWKACQRGRSLSGSRVSSDERLEEEFQKNLEDMEKEDENLEVRQILSDQHRRQRAMKYKRVQKLFPKTKEPRLLTNDMMEQIRFLYQEYPDDWDVKRLAQGFSVSEDAIRKVLRSKFSPKEKTSVKQDKIAIRNRSHLLGDGQKIIVDMNTTLPKRVAVQREIKQEFLEDRKSSNTKYLNDGKREQKKYTTYRTIRKTDS